MLRKVAEFVGLVALVAGAIYVGLHPGCPKKPVSDAVEEVLAHPPSPSPPLNLRLLGTDTFGIPRSQDWSEIHGFCDIQDNLIYVILSGAGVAMSTIPKGCQQ